MKEHYDKVYSEDKKAFGGGKPENIVMEGAKLLSPGAKVIEFGAGQGRNALALARLGLRVEAVDISSVGVDLIKEAAQKESLTTLGAKVGDAFEEIKGEYDMILTTFMLHHFLRDKALKFIDQVKTHTKPGGINAIATFTAEGDFFKMPKNKANFYPTLGELRSLYSDWEIINYDEEKSRARVTNPDGSPMYNIKAEILARKP